MTIPSASVNEPNLPVFNKLPLLNTLINRYSDGKRGGIIFDMSILHKIGTRYSLSLGYNAMRFSDAKCAETHLSKECLNAI